MRLRDLDSLPPTLTATEVADLWGTTVDHVWRLAREGRCPVPPLRLGRSLRWPTPKVLAALGVNGQVSEDSDAPQ